MPTVGSNPTLSAKPHSGTTHLPTFLLFPAAFTWLPRPISPD